ncbi:MAG: V-type ATP synthase subunit K [Candidatus Altiarchaeales archaeon]|nr:V-type ATP synthase subunit K [Candidatus Altiarchaeales archaeon]
MVLESIGTHGLAAFGAGAAVVLSGIGTMKGLEIAGHAAAGVSAEDSENARNALILQALPQTQVIYGFIIAIIIIIGLLNEKITAENTWICILSGFLVGLTGLSAINQGKVAASSIGAAAKNQSIFGNLLIYVVMVEITALFGFVIALMLLLSGQVI